ncbi:MAG: adenylate/guanylate cyclase domain-containing protein [Armatimonadetes bacterium]|nr:adenylate/guanylate cyclase domain-containing protein [Armatimonadota bacterium]
MRRDTAPENQSGHQAIAPLLTVLGVGLLIVAWTLTPPGDILERFELRTIDARFLNRGARTSSDQIVIVAVDDNSLTRVGPWPWPRERYARLIEVLREAGARVIAFDILLAEPGPGGARSDQALVRACRDYGSTVHAAALLSGAENRPDGASATDGLARFALPRTNISRGVGLNAFSHLYSATGAIGPLPEIARVARGVGFVDVIASLDGIYRESPPVVQAGGGLYQSLWLSVAARALGVPSEEIQVRMGSHVQLGAQRRIPIGREGTMLINFAGPGQPFPHVSAGDLLAGSAEVQPDTFRDKIVFIAVTAIGLHDVRPTPFEPVAKGVEVQANALDTVLTGQFIRRWRPEATLLAVLVWTLLIGALVTTTRARVHVPVAAACLVLHNALAVWAFNRFGVIAPMFVPSLAMVLSLLAAISVRVITQERKESALMNTLAQFVPPEVAALLTQDDADAAFVGETRTVTVLFADLRGFTAASRRLGAERTVVLLNRYFELMHEVIFSFGGTLDKFMGDEIMAFFNAPVEQVDHPRLAVACALTMQQRIARRRDEWAFLGMPELAAGIGIDTGESIVGCVGSGSRMQYTVIGENVNLASRLQALCKDLGASIIISEATYDLVRDMVECRDLGLQEIRGIDEPHRVYEVLGMLETPQANDIGSAHDEAQPQ